MSSSVLFSDDMCADGRRADGTQTHNLVCVLMAQNGVDRQGAIELAGELWEKTLHWFFECRKVVPSWGPEIDADVAKYIQGLEDWIIANAEWSFETERYFGKDGPIVRKTRQVKLMPLRRESA